MSNIVNVLPLEIVFEILSRLPTESVLECKLVAKSWRDLVQQPSYEQLHLKHLNDADSGKLSFIFHTIGITKEFSYAEYDENLNKFSRIKRINLRPPFKFCYILASCNGLICFNSCYDICHYEPSYICNPITGEYIILPKPEGKDFLTGFGYCPSTNEYKVVRIWKSKGDPEFGLIQVYTLGSGIGWRNTGKMDYDVGSARQYHGVFANGAIYWVNREGTIFTFDLADEKFHKLPSLPDFPRACNPPLEFVDSGGNFQFGVPHKNTLVSLKALGEKDTKQMERGVRDERQKAVITSQRRRGNNERKAWKRK